MIIPLQKPEIIHLEDAICYTVGLVGFQIITVLSILSFYYTKSFLWLFGVCYGIVGVYCIGFALDNSPLLSISSLIICYGVVYFIFDVSFFYDKQIWMLLFVFVFVAAVLKEKYSHHIYEKKPILLNIPLYIILGIFPHIIPFYIYRQNQNYRYWSGLQML